MANAVLDAARAKRSKAQDKMDAMLAEAGERPVDERAFDDAEAEKFTDLAAKRTKLDKQIAELEKEEHRAEKASAAAAEAATAETEERTRVEHVSSPQTYGQFGPNSYFRDMASIAASSIDPAGYSNAAEGARARLQQHGKEVEIEARTNKALAGHLAELKMTPQSLRGGQILRGDYEERVNPNTTAGTGGEFVPPLWEVSKYAYMARPGRVIANRIPSQGLPPGIDIINIPKIKVGSSTAVQAAQANAVSSTDIQTSTISAAVNTIAGQEDISMQLLEQSPLAMDGVIFDDLSRDYDQRLDIQVISGSGISGQHKGALSITQATANTATAFNTDVSKANQVTCASTTFWDGTTATSFTQYRSIVNGVTNIEILRFASPTAIWAHPRRTNSWSLASDAATGRPLFVATSNGQYNVLGTQEGSPVTEGVAGVLYGLPVIKDANMPTTCVTGALTSGTGDAIGVVKEDDMILWEGTPRMRALPEILSGTLQIRFQLYCYSAFMPDRFAAGVSIITGTTGLAAPSW